MKVNLGSSEHKKSYFPISLDSSTTANFGECLPIFSHEVAPNTHASINIRDAVRFAPLSFPTFGKAYLKTYAFSHPISTLYPPFKAMLAQEPYTSGSGSTYVPTNVPNLPLWFLWLSVVSNCTFTLYKTSFTNSVITSNQFASNSPFTLTQLILNVVNNVKSTASGTPSLSNDDISVSLPLWLLMALQNGNSRLNGSVPYSSASGALLYMKNNSSPDKLFFNSRLSNRSTDYIGGTDNEQRSPVTPDSADFVFYLPASVSGYFQVNSQGNGVSYVNQSVTFDSSAPATSQDVLVCMRLNDSGKFLRKILMGLGYQVAPLDTNVSLLPLFAYFKSYFETFAPKRFVRFEQSYFSRLINMVVNSGSSVYAALTSVGSPSVYSNDVRWNNVIDDLLSCYYTKDTDYYSAQIIGMINDYGNSLSQRYLAVYKQSGEDPYIGSDVLSNNEDTPPAIDFRDPDLEPLTHTQSQQNILSRLTQFVNRRSAIGAKLADLLKSVFGIDQKVVDEYNAYLGSSSLDVNFGDVFSTAETSEGSLGEYAGKALASTNPDNPNYFDIECKEHSILLAFSVIIPRTQYVQGLNPLLTHVNHDSFYNPMFDGLTLLPTRRSSLYVGDGFQTFNDEGVSFGNLPIYTEYKTKSQGILTGDLSLNSTRSTYDSFTMDEIIASPHVVEYDNDSIPKTYNKLSLSPTALVAGTMWRYLGRWLWLGRFDRIFVNNRLSYEDFYNSMSFSNSFTLKSTRNVARTDDNLIVHHVVDLSLNSAMIPLSGTWMTDDLVSLDPYGVTTQTE